MCKSILSRRTGEAWEGEEEEKNGDKKEEGEHTVSGRGGAGLLRSAG